MVKRFINIILIFMITLCARSQMSVDLSFCSGSNYVSEGQYAKLSTQLSYKYLGWNFSLGAGTVFSHAREKKLDAVRVSLSKDFRIKGKQVTTHIFYQQSPFSVRLNDQTAGLLLNHKSRRWYFDLGANTRFYSFTKGYKATTNYTEKIIWEPVNVMYRLTWHKPIGNKFEINPSITNFDQFIIQQETNPFILIDFGYKFNEKSKMYFDAVYQQAGFFNIRVNYFGYYLRGGYKMDIGRRPNQGIKLKAIEL